jgi:hypothetical protein
MREQAHRIGQKSHSHRRIGTKRHGCYYRVGDDYSHSYEEELRKHGVDRDDALQLVRQTQFPSDQSV